MFIELTIPTGTKVLIRIDMICNVYVDETGTVMIVQDNKDTYPVKETYEEVKQLIQKGANVLTGTLI